LGFLCESGGSLILQLLGLLPGEFVTAEVAIRAGLLENGRLEVQVLDDPARPEVKVLPDDVREFRGGLGRGAVAEDGDG